MLTFFKRFNVIDLFGGRRKLDQIETDQIETKIIYGTNMETHN